jgi:hypothetical protein
MALRARRAHGRRWRRRARPSLGSRRATGEREDDVEQHENEPHERSYLRGPAHIGRAVLCRANDQSSSSIVGSSATAPGRGGSVPEDAAQARLIVGLGPVVGLADERPARHVGHVVLFGPAPRDVLVGRVVRRRREHVVERRRQRPRAIERRVDAEDELDRAPDRRLGVMHTRDAAPRPRADHDQRRAMVVDVITAVLRVVLDHEDHGVRPVRRVADRVRDDADRPPLSAITMACARPACDRACDRRASRRR